MLMHRQFSGSLVLIILLQCLYTTVTAQETTWGNYDYDRWHKNIVQAIDTTAVMKGDTVIRLFYNRGGCSPNTSHLIELSMHQKQFKAVHYLLFYDRIRRRQTVTDKRSIDACCLADTFNKLKQEGLYELEDHHLSQTLDSLGFCSYDWSGGNAPKHYLEIISYGKMKQVIIPASAYYYEKTGLPVFKKAHAIFSILQNMAAQNDLVEYVLQPSKTNKQKIPTGE